MKKEQLKSMSMVFGNVAKKVAESAVHAAVFAYVSNKVNSFLKKSEDKKSPPADSKIRVEENSKY